MRCPRCGQDADRRGATRMAAPMFAVCNNCDWPLPDKRKGNERKMKTMEERIMEIGAKVMDEMLLHKTDVTVMMKNSGSEFNIYVDVHLVTMFSNYEKEELEYKVQRVGLSEEGKRQLDEIWEMKKKLDEEDEEDERREEED